MGKRVSEGGYPRVFSGGGKGDSTRREDVSEMQRPSASFDFIHRRCNEWRSNEWHPAFVDIIRRNSRYGTREAAGRRRGCHLRSRSYTQMEKQEVYEKRFKSELIDFPRERSLR